MNSSTYVGPTFTQTPMSTVQPNVRTRPNPRQNVGATQHGLYRLGQKLCTVIRDIFRKFISMCIEAYNAMYSLISRHTFSLVRSNFRRSGSIINVHPPTTAIPIAWNTLAGHDFPEKLIPPVRLQVEPMADGSVVLMREAPLIRNLVLQGGGVKGMVYPTFLKTFDAHTGLLRNVNEIAGTSAGAMMAYMLAIGASLEKIERVVSESNIFEQMMGKAEGDITLGHGFLSAGNLMNTLRQLSQEEATIYFNQIKDDQAILMNIAFLEGYESFMERGLGGFQRGITFRDLKFLHILNPEKFKLLHVTGFNRQEKETVYFNADTHPEWLCHEAVRVSVAIPVVIQSVVVNGKSMTDGGEGSNVPLEVFSRRPDYNSAETMALVFDRNGKAHHILHAPKNDDDWRGKQPSRIKQWFLGPHYSENKKSDHDKIYSLGANAIVVPHGNLKTLSLRADRETIEAAKAEAHAAALAYARARKYCAHYESFPSREAAMGALTSEEQSCCSF
jgi:predicted acylesterase/phospholipase RssA